MKRAVAQLGSALVWGTRGRGFKSRQPDGDFGVVLMAVPPVVPPLRGKFMESDGSPDSKRRPATLADFPLLVSQFSPNQELSPSQLTPSSNRKVEWKCEQSHTWVTSVAQRTRQNTGCPFCANQRVWPGFNDLETHFPDLAREWHPTKNQSVRPSQVLHGSNTKYWWICESGHEFDTTVSRRTKRGVGCRVCSGNEVRKGSNDLATKCPEVASQWDFERNSGMSPSQVTYGSSKKRWWLCSTYKHSFVASPAKRTGSEKADCPYCSNQKLLVGFNDLGTVWPELAAQWDYAKNFPKTPEDFPLTLSQAVWWKCPERKHESWRSKSRKSTDCPVCMNQVLLSGFNDLASKQPALARQWHPTLNGGASPTDTLTGGRQKVWWLCDIGHHWEASVYSREKSGCPYCGFKRLWAGFNDLATVAPDLALEWDVPRNGQLAPNGIMSSVSTQVWWKCMQDDSHPSFRQSPNTRSRRRKDDRRSGCPVCSSRKVVAGINHLKDTHPELWYQLDTIRIPESVLGSLQAGSRYAAPWKCSEGHNWSALVYSRAVNGSGCPDCAEYGFKPLQPAILYFITNEELAAAKIGITNTHTRYDRVGDFTRNFGWHEEARWPMIGKLARAAEAQAFAWIRGDLGLPQKLDRLEMGRPGGETETFELSNLNRAKVIAKLDEIAKSVGGFGG